jgi:AcrR family transcriptional regulator
MPRSAAVLCSILAACAIASAAGAESSEEFIAAMQRVRMSLLEPPDSAALKRFPIYDYLVAARLRRDLTRAPDEDIDNAIDAFLRAHAGQPVSHALRHQWLMSLADRVPAMSPTRN